MESATEVKEVKEKVRERGTVDWFRGDFGYRFLKRENGSQVFAHFSEIEMDGFKTLQAGQVISFVVAETPKGPAAREVVVL